MDLIKKKKRNSIYHKRLEELPLQSIKPQNNKKKRKKNSVYPAADSKDSIRKYVRKLVL